MQDLFLLLATVLFLAAGFTTPFVMTLGYLWVDIFTPQDVSESILSGQPIAFIFGACAVGVYLLRDRREMPRLNPITVVQLLILVWITCTTQWAVAPGTAEWRYGVASKMCLFAAFLPYAIRSRVQIEAMVLVYVFAICGHLIPWGMKTFVTGGGYNQSLGLLRVNAALLAESSTVSGIAVAIVPLLLWASTWSILLPKHWSRKYGIFAVIAVSLVGAIGTFARTALVAFAVGGAAMFLRSRRKVLFIVGAVVLGGVMFSVTSDRWLDRISTVQDYQSETSAAVRLLVWEWAWNFAQSHPFGGGFWAFVTNRIEIPGVNGGAPTIQFSRAYHNIYFGVLADQGYPGFVLYMSMIVAVLFALQRTRKLTRATEEHRWCADLAQALQITIVTMLATGMFVEIGWSPIVWYLFSMAVCLREYARRVAGPVPPQVQLGRLLPAIPAPELGGPALGGPAVMQRGSTR